jgi:hypothetical protein
MAMEDPREQVNAQELELQLIDASRDDVVDQVRALLDQGVNIDAEDPGLVPAAVERFK